MADTAEYRKARYWKRRAEGLCVECKEKAVPGSSRCRKHLDLANERCLRNYHEKRAFAIEEGICIHPGCEQLAAPGRRRCGYHLEMEAERAAAKKKANVAKGLCQCGKPRQEGLNAKGKPILSCEGCYARGLRYNAAAKEKRKADKGIPHQNGVIE